MDGKKGTKKKRKKRGEKKYKKIYQNIVSLFAQKSQKERDASSLNNHRIFKLYTRGVTDHKDNARQRVGVVVAPESPKERNR